MSFLHENTFSVDFSYPTHFVRDVFAPDATVLEELSSRSGPDAPQPVPVLLLLDAGLAAAQPGLLSRIEAWVRHRPERFSWRGAPLLLPGGEACKEGLAVPEQILRHASGLGLCRKSQFWAVGGGAFLDAAGLAAALFHRGAPLVRFPSTVLSQCDSGVGVKNGCNLCASKNLAGVFAPPAAVVCDQELLTSLSDRDWRSGIAEAFKVAIIKDRPFLDWLLQHSGDLGGRHLSLMAELIRRCAKLHLQHISGGDPFERGAGRPLDFGHWLAHRLEELSGYSLRHGEAVSLGMCIDLRYAAAIGTICSAEADLCCRGLAACGLPVRHPLLNSREAGGRLVLLQGLDDFRRHLGGTLHVTLPAPLGSAIEVTAMDEGILSGLLEAAAG